MDVVINILQFDGRFTVRRGEIINKLDKDKYTDVIRFLLKKPVPHFKRNLISRIIDLRAYCYEIKLSSEIHILYNIAYNRYNDAEEIEIYLWKRGHPLNKLIYK